jgi:hypothetical protein
MTLKETRTGAKEIVLHKESLRACLKRMQKLGGISCAVGVGSDVSVALPVDEINSFWHNIGVT